MPIESRLDSALMPLAKRSQFRASPLCLCLKTPLLEARTLTLMLLVENLVNNLKNGNTQSSHFGGNKGPQKYTCFTIIYEERNEQFQELSSKIILNSQGILKGIIDPDDSWWKDA